MKQEIIITTVRDEIFHLTEEIHYHKQFKNDVEVFRKLVHIKHSGRGYDLSSNYKPLYKEDKSLLNKTNPFWFHNKFREECESFFKYDLPNNPKDVDLDKVILAYSYSHSFFDININPVATVFQGDYIEAGLNNKKYKLKELRDYLLDKPEVITISEILDIPSYNREKKKTEYIYLELLIDGETIKKMNEENKKWYDINYLNINQFLK